MKMRLLVALYLIVPLSIVSCSSSAGYVQSGQTHTLMPAEPSSQGLQIREINIDGYQAQTGGLIEAKFHWSTNKPCYFQFSVEPVDFGSPKNYGGTVKLYDVSQPLHSSLQVTKHSYDITLRSGDFHSYELIVWDTEGNSDRKEGIFQAEGTSMPHLGSSIDDVFLSRWGYTYYNDAPRVRYSGLDIDTLLIQITNQIPWQLYYEAGTFDCSEMTAYLEYVLERHGYTAEIAHGEVKGVGFHAWVLVYNNVAGCWMPIEATSFTGSLDAFLFQLITGDSLIEYRNPASTDADIFSVKSLSECDWWNSPYADQLVAASDKAKLAEPLPPLPKIEYPDLPPLPSLQPAEAKK